MPGPINQTLINEMIKFSGCFFVLIERGYASCNDDVLVKTENVNIMQLKMEVMSCNLQSYKIEVFLYLES